MKKLIAATVLLALLVTLGMTVNAAMAANESVVRHVVLFKFKDGTSPEDIKKVELAFSELPKKIDTIKGYEWGTDISPEKLSQGFTHCFFLTFADEKGRDAYLPHPAHKEFAAGLGPYLDKVLVIDYKTQK